MKRLFTGSLLCLAFAGGSVNAAVEPTEKTPSPWPNGAPPS